MRFRQRRTIALTDLDWPTLGDDLDERGFAVTPALLTADECHELSAGFEDPGLWRSTVVMARHGFGEGEYKYFADPLPPLVARLRTRLYPPLAMMTRYTAKDVELAGEHIKAGTLIGLPIYVIHRHRKLWDDPDRFDPSRFAPEREASYSRYQFMPFGAGPRICIGAAFAFVEATAMLATLFRAARFESPPVQEPIPVSRVVLLPKDGMPLQVTMRGRVSEQAHEG